MERATIENPSHTTDVGTLNQHLAREVIQSAIDRGVTEFFVCPAGRNAPFIPLLQNLKCHYGFEERATAFFALGRCKATQKPVAIITTSGTAVGEILPAAMEAAYSSLPLLIITGDRPRSYRGSGAPQSCDQVGIFSHYVNYTQDLEVGETVDLTPWDQKQPAHLNVCFEEPLLPSPNAITHPLINHHFENLNHFLHATHNLLVIVNAVEEDIVPFLLALNAPCILEAPSQLREQLPHLRVTIRTQIFETAAQHSYPIDGVLRIGAVPTLRLWRDLEQFKGKIPVFNISRAPFSGLSWTKVHAKTITMPTKTYSGFETWLKSMQPPSLTGEPLLIHKLSTKIPKGANIYLGNSLPIREWDLAATLEDRQFKISVSRGMNGIDGQISTFLGLSQPNQENWAIIGDLTALYDLSSPWFLSPDTRVNIVIINNGGGQIFKPMFPYPEFLNEHDISFEHFAKMWGLHYERWYDIPDNITCDCSRVIELRPQMRKD